MICIGFSLGLRPHEIPMYFTYTPEYRIGILIWFDHQHISYFMQPNWSPDFIILGNHHMIFIWFNHTINSLPSLIRSFLSHSHHLLFKTSYHPLRHHSQRTISVCYHILLWNCSFVSRLHVIWTYVVCYVLRECWKTFSNQINPISLWGTRAWHNYVIKQTCI